MRVPCSVFYFFFEYYACNHYYIQEDILDLRMSSFCHFGESHVFEFGGAREMVDAARAAELLETVVFIFSLFL